MCKLQYATFAKCSCRYFSKDKIQRCQDPSSSKALDQSNEVPYILLDGGRNTDLFCDPCPLRNRAMEVLIRVYVAGTSHFRTIDEWSGKHPCEVAITRLMDFRDWKQARLKCQIQVAPYGPAGVKCPHCDKESWYDGEEDRRRNEEWTKNEFPKIRK